MRRFLVVSSVILGLGALPKAADAAIITGDLQLTGAVGVTATTVTFYQFLIGGVGANVNTQAITGSTIEDGGVLVAPLQPPNLMNEKPLTALTTPPGVPNLNVDLFEYSQNPAAPVIDFVLDYVFTCPQLGPQYTCLGASPFGFIENAGGLSTTITLQMSGRVFDTATPSIQSNWTGLWTTNVNKSIAQIFATIETGGTIYNSISATKITAVVPEPATLLTFGAAMAFLVAHRRRRQAKNQA
jgi:hypothetical protein